MALPGDVHKTIVFVVSLQYDLANSGAHIHGVGAVFAIVKTDVVIDQFTLHLKAEVQYVFVGVKAAWPLDSAALGTKIVTHQLGKGAFTCAVAAENGPLLARLPVPVDVTYHWVNPVSCPNLFEVYN